MGLGLCNCRTLACRVDSICHLLRIRWRWLCDRHDADILNGI